MNTKTAAFLWDESFLWGLMAYKALKELSLPFDLVKAEDIRSGALKDYRMLFVPGGWASNKSRALGDSGIKAVQEFIERGGSYLGFCGGAGLATKAKGGIGLLDVKRMPTEKRVPSFSGRINLDVNDHSIWEGLSESNPCDQVPGSVEHDKPELRPPNAELIFHAWWPSQFIIEDDGIKVLAAYGEAMPDAFSSDLNVESVDAGGGWDEFEKTYQINLNPERLKDEPAVLEGLYSKGKVILSLIHFDTPGDINGQQVLINLWDYLAGRHNDNNPKKFCSNKHPHRAVGARRALPLQEICSDLISLGERNFLWFWRNSMLLQWRRGIRGLEYNTLYILIREICEITAQRNELHFIPPFREIENLLVPFVEEAKRLLILERHALQKGHITYDKCEDPEIKKIRTELFSKSKSYGGMFKNLIDKIDHVLFELLVQK